MLLPVLPLPDRLIQREKDFQAILGEILGDGFLMLMAGVDRPPLARHLAALECIHFGHLHTASPCDLQEPQFSLPLWSASVKKKLPGFASRNYRVGRQNGKAAISPACLGAFDTKDPAFDVDPQSSRFVGEAFHGN